MTCAAFFVRLTQASIVTPVVASSEFESGTLTESSTPSKRTAVSGSPGSPPGWPSVAPPA